MDAAPLTKVGLIVVGALATHVSWTAPAVPRDDEHAKFGKLDKGTVQGLNWLPAFYKATVWAATLCEAGVILANQYPSPSSQRTLNSLTFGRGEVAASTMLGISPAFLAGIVLEISGGFMRIACYRTLGRFFTFVPAVRKEHKLITEGPYALVRHPSYTALFLGSAGTLLVQLGRGSWIAESGVKDSKVGFTAVCLGVGSVLWMLGWTIYAAWKEDKVLRKEFGEQWDKWAKVTRWRILPGIY